MNWSTYFFVSFFNFFIYVSLHQAEVTINYNKLHADPKQGKSLDIGQFAYWQYPALLIVSSLLIYFFFFYKSFIPFKFVNLLPLTY